VSDLYDTDMVLWSEQQAALLRGFAASERSNEAALDREHVIEEIEDVGNSALRSVRSLIFQARLSELKAKAWPHSNLAEHWRGEARSFRVQAADQFLPSMRQRIDLARIYDSARRALPESIDGRPPLPSSPICTTLDEFLADLGQFHAE
jgi:Domain of unknown function DUF29